MDIAVETEKINYLNKVKRINMLSAPQETHGSVQFHRYVSVCSSGYYHTNSAA